MDGEFPAAEAFQDFVLSLPTELQWLGVMVAGALPFLESYFGSVLAIFVGLPAPLAISAAVTGNLVCTTAVVLLADRVRARRAVPDRELSSWEVWLQVRFHHHGLALASLLGNMLLPSQVTALLLVSFGAPRRFVLRWQVVAIVVYGVAAGSIALLLTHLVGGS